MDSVSAWRDVPNLAADRKPAMELVEPSGSTEGRCSRKTVGVFGLAFVFAAVVGAGIAALVAAFEKTKITNPECTGFPTLDGRSLGLFVCYKPGGDIFQLWPADSRWCPPDVPPYTRGECEDVMNWMLLNFQHLETTVVSGDITENLRTFIQNSQNKLWEVMQKFPHDSVADHMDRFQNLAAYMKTFVKTGLGFEVPDEDEVKVVDIFGPSTIFDLKEVEVQHCKRLLDKLLTFQTFNNNPTIRHIVSKESLRSIDQTLCKGLQAHFTGVVVDDVVNPKGVLRKYLKKGTTLIVSPETFPTYTLNVELNNVNDDAFDWNNKGALQLSLYGGDYGYKGLLMPVAEADGSVKARKWKDYPIWTNGGFTTYKLQLLDNDGNPRGGMPGRIEMGGEGDVKFDYYGVELACTYKLGETSYVKTQEIGVHVTFENAEKDYIYFFELFHPPLTTPMTTKWSVNIYESAHFQAAKQGELNIKMNVKLSQQIDKRELDVAGYRYREDEEVESSAKDENIVMVKYFVEDDAFEDPSADPKNQQTWEEIQNAINSLLEIGDPKMLGISGIYFVLLVSALSLGVLGRFFCVPAVALLDHQEIDLTSKLQSSV